MNRYEEYQETGFDWLGKIPSNWGLSRVGKFFTERSEKVDDVTYPPLSVTMSGIVDQLSDVAKTNDGGNRKLVKKHDFVINSRSDRKGSSGISPRDGSVSLINIVLEPRELDPQFIQYLFKNYYFKEEYFRNGKGIHWDLWTTRWDQLKNIKFPVPPVEEQKLISRYLDKKTKQIDSLIEKIQKKIELLKEQRTSLINQCVTKGLDPNVEMKDSGVEWIGEIPSHWEQTKLGYLGSLSNGVSRGSEYFGKGHPFITYGDVYKNDVISHPSSLCMSDERDWVTYSVCKGDIFFTRTSETTDDIGISSVCMDTIEKCCFSGFLIRFRPKGERLSPSFSRFYFRSTFPLIHFTKEMNQVTRSSLSQGLLKTCHVLIPPLQEQERISSYLEGTLEKLDFISEREIKRIDLLKEYRQSLISSVVTGKVRVTEDMI